MQLRRNSKALKESYSQINNSQSQSLSKIASFKKLVQPRMLACEIKPKIVIKSKLLRNNGQVPMMKELINYKNIVSKQLPKMPIEYITRLLFDGRHQCLVAMNDKDKMLGGACFRCFKDKPFAELVFMAICHEHKNKGIGSQIMDHLKEQLQKKPVNLLLTYADNSAIGFFQKQAFNKIIETQEKQWFGYIKAYEGGTLMQCKVDHKFKYTNFRETLKVQRQYMVDKIKKHIVGQSRYSMKILKKVLQMNNLDEQWKFLMVPGVMENAWCYEYEQRLQAQPEISLMLEQLYGIDCLRKIPSVKLIRTLQTSDKLVLSIDLPTIEKKIINGCYFKNFQELQSDLKAFLASVKLIEITNNELEAKVISILEQLRYRKLTLQQLDCVFRQPRVKKSTKGYKK